MANYPTSLDVLSNPAGGAVQGSTTPTHSGHHANANDILEALEAKLGTGSSTAAANTVLRGTGAGSTAFGQLVNADVAAAAAIDGSKLAAGGTANRVLATVDGTAVGMQLIVNDMVQDGTLTTAKLVQGKVPELLGRYVLAASSGGLLFSGIATTWSGLEVRVQGRVTASVVTEAILIRPTNDNGTNYFGQQTLVGAGATASAADLGSLTYAQVGLLPGASSSNANWVGVISTLIVGHAQPLFKTLLSTNYLNTNTTASNGTVRVHGATWALTGSITSLAVGPTASNFAAGSIISLYGLP